MLDGVVIDDAKLFNEKLREWEDFYNYNRPHAALGEQTPYERLGRKQNFVCKRSGSVPQKIDITTLDLVD